MGLVSILFMLGACSTRAAVPIATEEGDPDLYFVRGYRSADDPCKLTGETGFTVNFLDDAADLVTSPVSLSHSVLPGLKSRLNGVSSSLFPFNARRPA